MLGAQYLGINSCRPFLVTPGHVHRTSSLNNYQTKKNPDGSITFVLRTDPVVHNWIDSRGVPYGVVAVRWKTLTHPVSGTLKNAAQVVKVAPTGDTAFVGAAADGGGAFFLRIDRLSRGRGMRDGLEVASWRE